MPVCINTKCALAYSVVKCICKTFSAPENRSGYTVQYLGVQVEARHGDGLTLIYMSRCGSRLCAHPHEGCQLSKLGIGAMQGHNMFLAHSSYGKRQLKIFYMQRCNTSIPPLSSINSDRRQKTLRRSVCHLFLHFFVSHYSLLYYLNFP